MFIFYFKLLMNWLALLENSSSNLRIWNYFIDLIQKFNQKEQCKNSLDKIWIIMRIVKYIFINYFPVPS